MRVSEAETFTDRRINEDEDGLDSIMDRESHT